jgi:dihydropteroate synthase
MKSGKPLQVPESGAWVSSILPMMVETLAPAPALLGSVGDCILSGTKEMALGHKPRARRVSMAARDIRSELDSMGVSPMVSAGVETSAQQLAVRLNGLSWEQVAPLLSTLHGSGLVAFASSQRDSVLAIGTRQQFAFVLGQLAIMGEDWEPLRQCLATIIEPTLPAEWKLAHGRSLRLTGKTLVMGILNVSPESFSGDGIADPEVAVERAMAMVEAGADIVDIGGESTRPGAEPLPLEEELRRVLPVVERLAGRIEAVLSIDTYKPRVAEAALQAGAHIVNDVFALRSPGMPEVVARHHAGVVLMHMLGEPRTMQLHPTYVDLMDEIYSFLAERVEVALAAGVRRESLVVDPGIGFGKRADHNLEIIRRLQELTSLGLPVLVGPSRKSFIGKVLGTPVEQRVEGTAAVVALAIAHGAAIVRVHDVPAMVRVVRMADAVMGRVGVDG